MKTKKQRIWTVAAAVLLLAAVSVGIYFVSAGSGREIPTMNISGSYMIDVDNPYELVGDAGYVFVAAVEDSETEYLYPAEIESETGGTKTVSTPYTRYTVRVLKNIKGELVTDRSIQLLKRGGLAEDKSAYYVFSDDFLPEVGGTYIFLAYGQKDGSLLVSGPNSNMELTLPAASRGSDDILEAIQSAPEYKLIVDAYENQITKTDREYFLSEYDVDWINQSAE